MKAHTVADGDGLKLHVHEWGSEGAPAILLIHARRALG